METTRYGLFDPEDENRPDIPEVYKYRRDQGSGRLAPAWKDIKPPDLRPAILPRIRVVDVSGEGPDFRYRFWGTGLTNMHRHDLTGKSVMNLKPRAYAQSIHDQYKHAFDQQRPQGFLSAIPMESGPVSYHAATRMPLSSDGETIDMISSAEEYGQHRDQLRETLEKVFEQQTVT